MPSSEAVEYEKFFFEAMGSATFPPSAPDLRSMFEGFGKLAGPLAPGTSVQSVDAGGVPAVWVVPAGAGDDVIVYYHGGGYVMGSAETHTGVAGHLAQRAGSRALVVDYGLAPEHPHPEPVEDCFAAYSWLLETGLDSQQVFFAGESAGGALTITTQHLAKTRGTPLPAATASLSPWVDLGDRQSSPFAMLFLTDEVEPTDRLVNPIHGDFAGFGPLLVQVGGAEEAGGFVDAARDLADAARAAGVKVDFEVVPEMLHMFQLCAGNMPEADTALDRISAFFAEAR
jgi:acetyl esterase/lipase